MEEFDDGLPQRQFDNVCWVHFQSVFFQGFIIDSNLNSCFALVFSLFISLINLVSICELF